MAGFEGPRDPGADDPGATKLPTWAVTRKDPEVDTGVGTAPEREGFADLGSDPARGQRAVPPVARVPEHPFDIDDPFGDKQLGGVSSPWIRPPADDTEVRVVDLADEFHLTTAQALEVCEAAGAPATSGAAWLTLAQAEAFRSAVTRYNRSASSDESFPDWAIPPGGHRPDGAVTGAATAPAVHPFAPDTAPTVPNPDARRAALGGDLEAEASAPTGSSAMRIVLLVVASLAVVALLAVLFTR